jgi:hypothetical protein
MTNGGIGLDFQTSEATDKLDAALAKAQGEIQAASKDKTNPAFRSRYADLTAVWEACRDALTKNGISVTQWPVHGDDSRLHIVTRVAHAGQWIRAHFSMPVPKQDPQGYGSALTYAKRYALSAAVGVVADEDDDGNAASQGQRQQGKPADKRVDVGKPTQKQLEYLDNMMGSSVFTDRERDRAAEAAASGDRDRVSSAVEWAKAELDARKAVPA